jgi:hypothetical protein
MARKKNIVVVKAVKRLVRYEHQQLAVDAYVKQQIRKFYLIWHRRAGKDTDSLEFARERMDERVGNYWHLFPFHIQAKRAIWKGIDARDGIRFIDRAFPDRVRSKDNDTEMSIVMPNGSTWQMLGSDNYDRAVGANPCGLTFSEWALCDPAAWDYFRPILLENKGWVRFITTLRGRNHAYRMLQSLKDLGDWYVDVRTIRDTHRHDGSPIVSEEDVENEIKQGMSRALARQEFYCDPDAASEGAIFTRQNSLLTFRQPIQLARNNRVMRVAWGMKDEGIAGITFQDNHIIAVHAFLEQNLVDAIQSVQRRHPDYQLVHHAVNPDPSLYSPMDGAGVVKAPLAADIHTIHGHAAAMLNTCEMTSIARERLLDVSMQYAPWRDRLDDIDERLVDDAIIQAVAVMHTAQALRKVAPRKALDYSRYDRGIV